MLLEWLAIFRDIFPGDRIHELAKRLFRMDLNAAIEGAIDEGAGEIVVLDGYGPGFSIILEDLNPRAQRYGEKST
ncbi:MAG: M55 family metallopeptidase [Thermoproteota archaeon]